MDIQHYLPLLRYKPGALKNSLALHQAREQEQWPCQYDEYWVALKQRLGEYEGTKQFVELLWRVRGYESSIITSAIDQSMNCGAISPDSVVMLIRQKTAPMQKCIKPLQINEQLSQFEHPPGGVKHYDDLLINFGENSCQQSTH